VRLPGHLVEAWIVRRGSHSRHDRKAQVPGHVRHRCLATSITAQNFGNLCRFRPQR
jgi:hypothetical protein